MLLTAGQESECYGSVASSCRLARYPLASASCRAPNSAAMHACLGKEARILDAAQAKVAEQLQREAVCIDWETL